MQTIATTHSLTFIDGKEPSSGPGEAECESSSQPSSVFDASYKPRPLACKKCGWIIGIVMRVKTTTHNVRRLWVFTFARDANTIPPTVQLQSPHRRSLFRVHGMDQCDGVECTHCGELTPWSMSMEAYLRLLNYYQRSRD